MDFIYIHKGYSWYVPLAIRNGKAFCRGTVHYLGGKYGRVLARTFGAETALIKDYDDSADKLAQIYQHHSTLGADFELFCIQRWFILRDYMKKQRIKQAIYLDTDILVCEPLDPFIEKFKGYGMTFTGYSAHINFILDWGVLDQFCDFIMELYSNFEHRQKIINWAKNIQTGAGAGGVSDMTLFYWFHEKYPQKIVSYNDVFDFSPFDNSLDDVRECEGDVSGLKKIDWRDNTPYVILKINQKKIKLSTLHHQGRAKKNIYKNAAIITKTFLPPKALWILISKIYGLSRRIFPNI